MTYPGAAVRKGTRGIWTAAALILSAVIGTALLASPFLVDNYSLRVLTTIMMYCVLAASWNFIGGFVGYPSFGIAAFFGFGAYTGAVLLSHKLIPFWFSPFAGGIAAGIVAILLGAPILKLRGHYFAVASFAISEVFRELAMTSTEITGGGMGVNLPSFTVGALTGPQFFYFAMLALACAVLITSWLVSRSRLGVAFRCIRQNEEAAVMIGIDTTKAKIIAFALSSAFPGCAGALYASWVGYIDPSDVFDILISVKAPVMALLGGVGTVLGPMLGAVLYLLFEEVVWRNFLQFHSAILGVIIVGLVLFMPGGLSELTRRKPAKRPTT
jgi:branched-chain amino acid transport system permease protein